MMHISNGQASNLSQTNINGIVDQNGSGFSDTQLMVMKAPDHVNNLMWDLSNAQERRDLMNDANQQGPSEAGDAATFTQPNQPTLARLAALQSRPRKMTHTKSSRPKEQGLFGAPQDNAHHTSARESLLQRDPNDDAARQSGGGQEQQALSDITRQFQQRFSETAQDKSAFHDLMSKTFGNQYDQGKAESIRQQTLNGDFSWMPDIKLVDGGQFADTSGTQNRGVGQGAYSQAEDTVYLSRDLLTTDKAEAEKVLTEEIGHAIDTRVNVLDANGDEGEIFSRFMHGEKLSDQTLQELKQENDGGTIEIDGKRVAVEYNWISDTFKSAVKHTKKAVKSAVDHTKNAIKSAAEHTKNAVKSTIEHTKSAIKSAGKHIKKGFQKVIQSKFFQGVLTVAQFIPGVGLYAKAINMVASAYNVYQGIKHRSWGAVLGGVAGVAGGIGKLGQAFGASTGFVNSASNIAQKASTAAMAYQAIAKKDFVAAAGLAANFFDGDSNVRDVLHKANQANQVYQSVKRGDYLSAIGAGSTLVQEITGSQDDSILQTIGNNAQTLQQVRNAVEAGRYDTAASLLTDEYGGTIGLSGQQQEKINQVAGAFQNMHDAKQMIQDHNYADAAQLLLKTAQDHTGSAETQRHLLQAGQTIQQIHHTVTTVKAGNYSEGLAKASELLNYPLDEQSLVFLTQLQNYAKDGKELAQMVKSGAPQEVIKVIKKRMEEQAVIYNVLKQAA